MNSESELLGRVTSLYDAGSAVAAEKHCLRALKKYPGSYNLLHFLGVMYLQRNMIKSALDAFKRALEIRSDDANLFHNLGLCYFYRRQYDQAVPYLQRAVAMESNPLFTKHLALAYAGDGNDEAAEDQFKRFITQTGAASAWLEYGKFLHLRARYDEAENALQQALALEPQLELAHMELADLYLNWLRFDRMYQQYERLLALYKNPTNHSAYLFALNNNPELDGDGLYEYYRSYNRLYAVPPEQRCKHTPRPQAVGRKIRIAYVCANANSRSSVSRFLQPLIENHDQGAFEIYMYSVDSLDIAALLQREKSADRINELHDAQQKNARDSARRQYKRLAHRWIDVTRLSDADLVSQIRRDKIDILVDVIGHNSGERLRALSHKPAPVMVTWLGYGYTTGLEVMDYFLGDAEFTPPGCEAFYSEEIYRLSRPPFTYQPSAAMPAVGPLPARANGYVTFGCFSRAIRFNPPLLECWAELLRRVPDSRLVLNTSHFGIEANCRIFEDTFARLGVEAGRLQLLNTVAPETWDEYNKIDIALDPFPHNAGTTTFDALWMGAPVLSLEGSFSTQRFCSMLLRPLGLEQWITSSPDALIERGATLASDLNALESLRGELRERLRKSAFLDAPGLAREFERAYTDMHQRFLGRAD